VDDGGRFDLLRARQEVREGLADEVGLGHAEEVELVARDGQERGADVDPKADDDARRQEDPERVGGTVG
jgi:hypothetical protein